MAAVDAWLIIAAVILCIVIIVVSGLLIINFGHPDDKNTAWLPKFVVLIGMFLAASTVLAMPFDVANSQGTTSSLNITTLWYIIFIADAVFLIFVLPFAFFYYENDYDREAQAKEERRVLQHQGCIALKYTLVSAVIFIVILTVMYLLLGTAEIPVTKITQGSTLWSTDPTQIFRDNDRTCPSGSCATSTYIWSLPVTLPIYIITMLSFLGWFLFAIFVGVGLVALPADLINNYLTRPIPLTSKE